MSARKTCREVNCGFDMPLSMQQCPHCGRPRLFPNVDAATMAGEEAELEKRYAKATIDATTRGAANRVSSFELAIVASKALMCTSFQEVQRIAKSDNDLAATFYARGASNLEKGSHVLQGKAWDAIRPAAESALFGDDNKREIHFAALSLDDLGLSHYGDCSITLRTALISHRTSAFEENMLVFFKKRGANYWQEERLPVGFRSSWEFRGKLAVAKLAGRIDAMTGDAEFANILLTPGKTSAEDEFIELHVFGELTARSFEKVVLTKRPANIKKAILSAVKHDLQKLDVKWEDRSTTR